MEMVGKCSPNANKESEDVIVGYWRRDSNWKGVMSLLFWPGKEVEMPLDVSAKGSIHPHVFVQQSGT